MQQKRYSTEDLGTFEAMIEDKIRKAHIELKAIRETLGRKEENGTESSIKLLEDSSDTIEKENLSQLAGRQRKFIEQLEAAMVRIKNGTYGICIVTGELIDKERLRAVPHTRHSLAAKLTA